MPVKKKLVIDYLDNPNKVIYKQRLTMAWEAITNSNGIFLVYKAAD
jgi:hypothetical protein